MTLPVWLTRVDGTAEDGIAGAVSVRRCMWMWLGSAAPEDGVDEGLPSMVGPE